MLEIFDGYDPASRTLAWHVTVGTCMGAEWGNCAYGADAALPVRSGDAVRFGICYPDGRVAWFLKWLEYGEYPSGGPGWWLQCRDGTFRLGEVGPFWIERVVARRRVPGAPIPRDPATLASEAEFLRYEDDSRIARLSWHLRGREWGREFPRDALRIDAPPGGLAGARVTIPSANEMRPSEPLDFEVTKIAGTIHLAWKRPIVFPNGTAYQVLTAPFSLSVPDSKVVVSESTGERVVLPVLTTSAQYLQVRAFANSNFSAFVPNTFGVPTGELSTSAPPAGGAWQATISPSYLSKVGTSATITTGLATVSINSPVSPSYAWSQVSATGSLAIISPSAFQTTFRATLMSDGEQRSGTFKCTVTDNSGVNSVALVVDVQIYRSSLA